MARRKLVHDGISVLIVEHISELLSNDSLVSFVDDMDDGNIMVECDSCHTKQPYSMVCDCGKNLVLPGWCEW